MRVSDFMQERLIQAQVDITQAETTATRRGGYVADEGAKPVSKWQDTISKDSIADPSPEIAQAGEGASPVSRWRDTMSRDFIANMGMLELMKM